MLRSYSPEAAAEAANQKPSDAASGPDGRGVFVCKGLGFRGQFYELLGVI